MADEVPSDRVCECGHTAEMHPLRMTGRRTRREDCYNEGCHCTRYVPLAWVSPKIIGPFHPCNWCGTWEASGGDSLCPRCQEADEDSPTTPPQYKSTAVNFTTPAWSVLTDVPGDTVVEDHHGNHWKFLSSTGLWYVDKPWDEATTFQIDRAEGPYRYIRTITADPFAEKEEPTVPKITTSTTTSISSSNGFTIGDLQSFLDQVKRPHGLNTPITVSFSPNTEWGVDGSTVTLSITSEVER